MKTITITSAMRPQYFKQAIRSLEENDTSGYDKLYINCEPCDENIEIARSIDFIDTDIEVNNVRLGVRNNPFRVLTRAFDDGSDFNIHLEEDIIIAPDATQLCDWYYDTFKDDPLKYHSYNLCNYDSDPSDSDIVVVADDFAVIGWSAFKENWNKYFKPYWFDDELNNKVWGPQTVGWDWAIQANRKQNGLMLLKPIASRSTHIGKFGGVHCSPTHQDNVFSGLIMCSDTDCDFKLEIF